MQIRLVVLMLRIAITACLVFAAYQCLVFARASFLYGQDTATSVPEALALAPSNGSYAARLAAWQPQRKEELLSKAVSLNPFDVDSWIQLGLNAELQNGDAQAAERYYLRAAEVDKMFRPRWTLTNFYFRQQRASEFFHWARATLEITPYQAEPVFAQMWLMSSDAAKLSNFIPNKPSILLQYALYLQKENQFHAIPPVIRLLTASVKAREAHSYGRDDLIGPMEDRLLSAGEFDPALRIWTALCNAQWLPYPAPAQSNPVTNGDFRKPFFGHGFDWATGNTNGVSISQNPEEGMVRFAFSGDEPDQQGLLRQFIALEPAKRYRLEWRAEADGIRAPSGLTWHIFSAAKNTAPRDSQSNDLLSSPSPHWDFTNGSVDGAVLALAYTRPLGSTRATGAITLRSVSLKEDDQPHEKE